MASSSTQRSPSRLSHRQSMGVLLGACCLSLLITSPLLLLSDDQILDRHGSDDLFCFLQVAEHSAPLSAWLSPGQEQPLISFDGIHATNGVQPAWWTITSVLVSVVREEHQLRALLTLAVLFHLAAGIFLFLWLSRLRGKVHTIALAAAALWILHPRPLSTALEGTEAGLLAFVWALTLWLWSRSTSDLEQAPSTKHAAIPRSTTLLSLALAFGVLTRIDFVLPAMAFSIFVPSSHALPKRRRFSQIVRLALPWIAAIAGWIILGAFSTGSPSPDSGAAKTLHRQFLETSANDVRDSCEGGQLPPTTLSENRVANFSTFFLGAKLITKHLVENGTSSTLFAALSLVAIAVFLARRHLTADLSRSIASNAWPLGVGLPLVLFYLNTLGFVRSWYLVPLALLLTLVAAVGHTVLYQTLCTALAKLRSPAHRTRWSWLNARSVSTVLFLGWITVAHLETRLAPARPYNGSIHRSVASLAESVPPGMRVGAFNAGIPSRVFGRRNPVVNLDGVVNRSARAALKSGSLGDYLRNEDIHFIVDLQTTIQFFEQHSCSAWTQDFLVIGKSPPLSSSSNSSLVLLQRKDKAPPITRRDPVPSQ